MRHDQDARPTAPPTPLRWRLAGEGPPGLFEVEDLVTPVAGTGRMSGLEFLHVTAKKILNHVPSGSRAPTNWTINVYRGCSHACRYCFARPTHEYLGLNLGEDFDRRIVVKINAVERVRAELAATTWRREPVAMGTNTDPYQRAEAKYRLTRGVLEALSEHRTPFSILTKSPLVTRDLDVLRAAGDRADVRVNFSIGTLDQQVWRSSEPGSPNPRRRIAAMAELADAGIRVGALVAPVLPGLSDSPRHLREVVTAIDDAGGRLLGISALYLRPGVREHFMGWLRGAYPAQYESYLHRYAHGPYAPTHYLDRLYLDAGLERAATSDPKQALAHRPSLRQGEAHSHAERHR